jgi:urea carboxylase
LEVKLEEHHFRLADYLRFLDRENASISGFKTAQQAAFEAERQRWLETGQLNFSTETPVTVSDDASSRFANAHLVESHVPGNIWKVRTQQGSKVRRGEVLVIVESMKMEIAIEATASGTVLEVLVGEGRAIAAGQALVAIQPD